MAEGHYFWTTEKLQYMREAYEEIGFHRALAAKAAEQIEPGSTVCDAGCGLGFLAMELCGHASQVIAADIQEEPLSILRTVAEKRNLPNLTIRQMNIFEAPEDFCPDHFVFSFFGQIPQVLKLLAGHCGKSAVLFRKDWPYHRMSKEQIPLSRLIFRRDCEYLEEAGVPFSSEVFSVDMGQPFRNVEEAVRFFRLYSRDDEPEILTEADVRAKLVPRESEEFPLYYPMMGRIGMIVMRREELG